MKTSSKIVSALKGAGCKCDIGQIARLLPRITKKQISCSLTRLIVSGVVKFELSGRAQILGNNKKNRVYWV